MSDDTIDTVQTWTIHSPNPDYTGISGSVKFRNGKGVTDDRSLLPWLRRHGYRVTKGGEPLKVEHTSVKPGEFTRAPASRDAAVLGAAAAGPLSDAENAPIGAGLGKDPHGEEVFSAGIHGDERNKPVVEGAVSDSDQVQTAKEQADALDAIDAPPIDALPRPSKTAKKADWVAFAVVNGMTEDEASGLKRDEIVARFPEGVEVADERNGDLPAEEAADETSTPESSSVDGETPGTSDETGVTDGDIDGAGDPADADGGTPEIEHVEQSGVGEQTEEIL